MFSSEDLLWVSASRLFSFDSKKTIVSIFFAMLLLIAGQPAMGQLLEPPPDPVERQKEFESLSREVDEIQRTIRVLKKCTTLVKPSVVHIEADKVESQTGARRGVEEAGSGFVIEINKKNYVITNRHVVNESPTTNIRIKLADARIINPTSVVSDKSTDIAVLEVKAENLVAARMGDSDKVEITDFVLAVGSPFGLSQSVTFGIISAKGRHDLELSPEVDIQDFLQSDAAINPGNSGGPLVSLRGEIIGMNTAIASQSGGGEGIGFAIPSNIVMNVAKQLINKGVVTRAFMGVTLDHKFTPDLAAKLGLPRTVGARVTAITARSPAEEAKIQIDDVILEINGIPIENDSHLISLIGLSDVGKTLPIKVYREKKVIAVDVQLVVKPPKNN